MKYKNPNKRKRKAQIIGILSLGLMGALIVLLLMIKSANPIFFVKYKAFMIVIVLLALVAFVISLKYVISVAGEKDTNL